MAAKNPPRKAGLLIILLGAVMVVGGWKIVSMGGDIHFIVTGIGVLLSGVLVMTGRKLGLYLYAATLVFAVVWSLLTVGANPELLLPRLGIPVLLGLYVFSGKVRPRLH